MKVQQFVTALDSGYKLTDEEADLLFNRASGIEILTHNLVLQHTFENIGEPIENLVHNLLYSNDYQNTIETTIQIEHQVAFAYSVFVIKKDSVSSTMDLGLSLVDQVLKTSNIINKLTLSSAFENKAELTSQIAFTMALVHSLESVEKEKITSEFVFTSEFKDLLITYEAIVVQVQFSLSLKQSLLVTLTESINFSHSTSTVAHLYSAIKNKLNFSSSFLFNLEGETFLAYALNTVTSGVSEYTDINYNSMDFPLACKSDGIYRMDQAQDDSVIASIKTGLMDFGNSIKKNVPYVYLGIANNERVIVKTTTINRGIKTERHYEVKSYTNANDTTRGQLGRGVKSKSWQFELSEIKDRIDSFEVMYSLTTRRV